MSPDEPATPPQRTSQHIPSAPGPYGYGIEQGSATRAQLDEQLDGMDDAWGRPHAWNF